MTKQGLSPSVDVFETDLRIQTLCLAPARAGANGRRRDRGGDVNPQVSKSNASV